MGNLSITLGSSFYSSGGDTINQKTWPTAPTGDNVSPGTGTDTGGSGGSGSGHPSGYDAATVEAITYLNNVLTRGYGDVDPTTTGDFDYDDGMGSGSQNLLTTTPSNTLTWGSNDANNLSSLNGNYTNSMKTVYYNGVREIDLNTVTGLDQPWLSVARSIPNYTASSDFEDVWTSDGSMYGTNATAQFDYSGSSIPTQRLLPGIALTEDLMLMFQVGNHPQGGFQQMGMTPMSVNFILNGTGTGNSFENLNSYYWDNMYSITIGLDGGKTVAEILYDVAKLFDSYNHGNGNNPTLSSNTTATRSENLYLDMDFMNSYMTAGYDWSIGIARVTSMM